MDKSVHDLAHELQQAIGKENVAFDDTTRYLYSSDASNYQIMPHGVVFPRHADDVSAIHTLAAKYGVPVLPRGSGTSLAGQTVGNAVLLDFTRHMRRVLAVNGEERSIQVQPGLVLEQMNRQLAPLKLMFGPDPASANRATLGGVIANNSTGTHSILYRMTSDHLRWVEIVLANGEKVRLGNHQHQQHNPTTKRLQAGVAQILQTYATSIATRYPQTWRTVAGYALNRLKSGDIDLAQLITGSEGTLGSIVAAELNLVERPKQTCLAIIHFGDLYTALEVTPTLLETYPSAIELMDDTLIARTRNQPEFARKLHFVEGNPRALLIVEYYGENMADLQFKVERMGTHLKGIGYQGTIIELYDNRQKDVWEVRKAGLGLLSSNRSDWKTVAAIEDAAVPVEHLATYIREIEGIIHNAGAEMSLYAHASAGCLHVRPLLNLKTAEGVRQYRQIAENAVDAVLKFGGTTSGEHGEGLVRSEFSERLFGAELTRAFHEVKQLFDPQNLLNPGKVVNAPRMDENLRYGADYSTPLELVKTRFDWSSDSGFAGAVEMCNGAGVCRKEENGVMCPSFMATREEKDSTRARANILRLAMSGKLGMNGMEDERVKDVLDLCLSCKACKAECPSAVDMARIKAEFMAHYYERHGIPMRSRLFANVHRLNGVAVRYPKAANRVLNMPVASTMGKRLLGIAPQRQIPEFAPQPLSQIASTTPTDAPLLLIDTFLEYYEPQIGKALLYLAQQMDIPLAMQRLPGDGCCGRPAISKGLLDQAKTMLNRMVSGLTGLLADYPDVRFMLVEPSCLSVLRDDMVDLVDTRWRATAQEITQRTLSVAEWLDECRAAGLFERLQWDNQPREILLHGHCHQKALWGTGADLRLLQAIPQATVRELDAGCCGMAGSFGYEAEHFAVSMAIAEQRLYPAVRENPNAIIVATGTSCRDQIQHIGCKALHPVEVLAMACGYSGV